MSSFDFSKFMKCIKDLSYANIFEQDDNFKKFFNTKTDKDGNLIPLNPN